MTIRLYDEDAYIKEFDAKVIELYGKHVELEETAFYAESGGQSGDTGFLNNERVVNTIYDDNKHVHVMEKEPSFDIGETIHGEISWYRRYKIMRLHSASHIMEYFLWKNFGYMERLGSNVDDRKDRADYVHDGRLDPDLLYKTEKEINQFFAENHEITITEDKEGIRTWKCGPVEMHCAGTHVKNTKEIGQIKLKRKNPGRGKERIETYLKE